MPKNKQQKKKDRERRVAQKKLAEAQKRAQDHTAKQAQTGATRTNKLAAAGAAVAPPKVEHVPVAPKHSFIRRRSPGG